MEEFYEIAFSNLVSHIRAYNPMLDVDFLKNAYSFSYETHKGQLRKSGEPYFQHCLEVAKILISLRLDTATIVSGLLHDVIEDSATTLQEIEEIFGTEIAILVYGVSGIRRLKTISSEEKTDERYIENYIKMLLSVIKDIRVVLIKLADRLHNMRTLQHLAEKKQREIAIETREIYVPLANRLGLSKIKSELEDLIFKFLDLEEYKMLAGKVNEKRRQREEYIQRIMLPIQAQLVSHGINAKVEGRLKSLYSIYKKIKNRNFTLEEMHDLFAIRIIVEKLEECYIVLDIIHHNLTPCLEKFRDYIKMPKPNGYKSLHTVILSQEIEMVEVQIRTEEMHKIAEDGIAAHWKYKEGKLEDSELDHYLVDFRHWLRQLADLHQELKDNSEEVLEHLKINLFKDEIFVYTPQNRLLRLPAESTPVDFAFAVHTDLGIHCLGAKVNGSIVPLNYKLQSGETVEIIRSSHQKPSLDWLNFVRTAKAYSKIKHWFKESMREQSRKLGETIIQHELKHFNIKKDDIDFDAIAKICGFTDIQEFYYAIGSGHFSLQKVINAISTEKQVLEIDEKTINKYRSKIRYSTKGVLVQGLDNILIHFGKCCEPISGDHILGFVTKGRGVIIHRVGCKNILKLRENPERNIEVKWDTTARSNTHFMARLNMLGQDRKNFLRDISDAIAQTNTNIVRVDLHTTNSFIRGKIIIQVKNLLHLSRVINKISKVNGVINVERLDGAGEPVADLVSDVSSVWNKVN